tara:strand:+ start:332 stop:1018 length:687 start_codon:yes stop_codon:yes gene_type:complete
MAINVNQVYKAVLVVLQQEKRGVLTPTEFNKIATQAQQEIFTEYFDELNQLLRQPQTSLAYADRYALLDEKISLFKTTATEPLTASKVTVPTQVQELGTVIYNNREVQRIQKYEVYTTNESPLTAPTAFYPVYTYEDSVIELYPTLTGSITLNFLKFPADVKWGFTIDTELGNYIYSEQASTDFEIHKSDQPLLIDKILGYAGVMSRDQLALQLSASKEQQIDIDGQK